jgi:hypothetical protein
VGESVVAGIFADGLASTSPSFHWGVDPIDEKRDSSASTDRPDQPTDGDSSAISSPNVTPPSRHPVNTLPVAESSTASQVGSASSGGSQLKSRTFAQEIMLFTQQIESLASSSSSRDAPR